jgi:hypothetical protein
MRNRLICIGVHRRPISLFALPLACAVAQSIEGYLLDKKTNLAADERR